MVANLKVPVEKSMLENALERLFDKSNLRIAMFDSSDDHVTSSTISGKTMRINDARNLKLEPSFEKDFLFIINGKV